MTRLAFPYAIGPDGRSATVAYGSDAHCRQMLELLIFTLVGERVMRPELGSPVRQMVFGAGNGPVAAALQATLQATIAQWLSHLVDLRDLTVTFSDADAALQIEVTYETRQTKQAQKANWELNAP